jgi:hypothetical protein
VIRDDTLWLSTPQFKSSTMEIASTEQDFEVTIKARKLMFRQKTESNYFRWW